MIIFRKLENTLTGSVDGTPFNMPRTKKTVKSLEALQASNASVEEVMKLVANSRKLTIAGKNKYLEFNPVTQHYYLVFKGEISKFAIPPSLVKYIEESFDKDIDFMPVVKAWAYLLNNPRVNDAMIANFDVYLGTEFTDETSVAKLEEEGFSTAEAISMSTYPDIALTQEGLLATYKVAEMVTWAYVMEEDEDGNWSKVKNPKYKTVPAVIDPVTGEELEKAYIKLPEFKEDILFTPYIWKRGDKFFSGDKLGYVYEVGKVQRLPKKAVRNLENTMGGGGLYIGGLNYIKGFSNEDTHTLTCFVNPGDILSFQSSGHAIRVDALMPNNVLLEGTKLGGMYHSSEYAKVSEKRLAKIVKRALKAGVAVGEDFREMQNEISDRLIEEEDVEYSNIIITEF